MSGDYHLQEFLAASRDYPMPERRILIFGYILMERINDSLADAEKAACLLKGIRCKLNLIALPGPPSPWVETTR